MFSWWLFRHTHLGPWTTKPVIRVIKKKKKLNKITFLLIRDQSMWAERSERGAERAKYSQSAERVFIQRPERSLCLAPVPLRYRSHHESRACTNPPRIHLCLQQLTKLSAYTSKIVRCEGEMEFVKYLYIIGYRLRGGRGAGLLRVDFPFRAYVNRLEQPHCLRNTRVSGAVQHNWSGFFPQQSRNKPAPRPHRRQCVPDVRHRLKTAGCKRHADEF